MADAIRLGWRGRYGAHPNPRVGCVIVSQGRVVGRGWHERAGGPHAEVNALAEAGPAAAGSTVYVTLEPCSHEGKTPPCAEALIAAGVGRVVAAMTDPFPAVAGRGISALEAAGIDVSRGLLEAEARRLNEGYLSRIERHRPFVRMKIASSLDGATAMQSGESRWITGAEARRDVQRLRAASGAILTGSGTVLADDPSLTVRDIEVPAQPLRVVLDSTLRTPPSSKLMSAPGQTQFVCIDDTRRSGLEDAGASVYRVAARDNRVDIDSVLEILSDQDINDVLVESGPVLAGSLLESGSVDEVVIYQAPHIMGSQTRRMFATPSWQALDARFGLTVTDMRRVGSDMRITARPR